MHWTKLIQQSINKKHKIKIHDPELCLAHDVIPNNNLLSTWLSTVIIQMRQLNDNATKQ